MNTSTKVAVTLLAAANVVVIALMVGWAAGHLAHRDGAGHSQAIGRAAIAFGGTLTLAATLTLTILQMLE
ncbi:MULTISPECIES: hypothetical protein [unclassified Streptomyces]|uniref:hypothetical protein n=1 Tax=unclassified Streptomyces TaxID=2593676 RepID=UPI000DC7A902|nr:MULTISPECIES: hypothetical protein [unclassified Streptomyces]AWZ08685.1 hypothetical protein DRB89_33585 [Streptomyces sp. ICC4]AWZ16445.1 hypothetical protein DRB96_34240 [Streptomyces sp. ICC1]